MTETNYIWCQYTWIDLPLFQLKILHTTSIFSMQSVVLLTCQNPLTERVAQGPQLLLGNRFPLLLYPLYQLLAVLWSRWPQNGLLQSGPKMLNWVEVRRIAWPVPPNFHPRILDLGNGSPSCVQVAPSCISTAIFLRGKYCPSFRICVYIGSRCCR